jgi:hypothetical protein
MAIFGTESALPTADLELSTCLFLSILAKGVINCQKHLGMLITM